MQIILKFVERTDSIIVYSDAVVLYFKKLFACKIIQVCFVLMCYI